MQPSRVPTLTALAVLAILVAPLAQAQSDDVMISDLPLFQVGPHTFAMGEIPVEVVPGIEFRRLVVGYRCDVIAIFGAQLARTACRAAAVGDGDQPPEDFLAYAVERTYQPSDIRLTWWAKNGAKVLLVFVLMWPLSRWMQQRAHRGYLHRR